MTKTSKDLIEDIYKNFLKIITDNYLDSRDFNGTPLRNFNKLPEKALREIVAQLIRSGDIILLFSDTSENPHILRHSINSSIDDLIANFEKNKTDDCFAYPTTKILTEKIGQSFQSEPYTHHLKMGYPQLDLIFFEMSVLDRYYQDPRYEVHTDLTSGSINFVEEDGSIPDRDKIHLQTFGYGYDQNTKARLICAFPRYLHDLTPEHQRYWQSFQVENGFVDSGFIARSFHGSWDYTPSIFEAILTEQEDINKLSKMINGKSFFKKTFGTLPENFKPLSRPTESQFHAFIHTADKILSENIECNFFVGVNKFDEKGKSKGSLQLCEDWLNKIYKPASEEVIPSVINPLKKIRKIRQKPAHGLRPDKYDINFLNQQKDILKDIFWSLDGFRNILSTHPACKEYLPNDDLVELNIKY